MLCWKVASSQQQNLAQHLALKHPTLPSFGNCLSLSDKVLQNIHHSSKCSIMEHVGLTPFNLISLSISSHQLQCAGQLVKPVVPLTSCFCAAEFAAQCALIVAGQHDLKAGAGHPTVLIIS